MKQILRTTRALPVLFCLVTIAPGAFATPITGTLNVTGVGPTNVTSTAIDFTTPVNPFGDGFGLFNITGGSTGSFVPLAGTQASIRDLNAGVVPTGINVNYTNFVTFAAQPTWSITLLQLLPGVFSSAQCSSPAAAGQSCTPGSSSPFNLINTSSSSSILTFSFIGSAVDSTTPGLPTDVQGVFTIPYSNLSYQQLLAAVSDGGTVGGSISASITATSPSAVPEPGTLSTALLGGLLIAASLVKRRFVGRPSHFCRSSQPTNRSVYLPPPFSS